MLIIRLKETISMISGKTQLIAVVDRDELCDQCERWEMRTVGGAEPKTPPFLA